MSNVVISPFFKSHPVFRAEQVLSDVHLNDMLRYLEQENAQTRSQLIGTGIVQGFSYALNTEDAAARIVISNGKGVTTAGHLIIQDAEPDTITCSYAIPYQVKNLAEEFPELAAQFSDLTEEMIIHALVPDHLEGAENLTGRISVTELLDNHQDTGLAALQESVEIHTESCFITNCDERGATRKFAIKFLLIQLRSSSFSEQTIEVSTTQRLKRIHIPQSNSPLLPQAYRDACTNEHIEWLVDEIEVIRDHLIPTLSQLTNTQPIGFTGIHLVIKRDALFQERPHMMQYFYDFLIDLGQTVKDIIHLREDLKHEIHTLAHHYPNHLILGSLKGQNSAFNRSYFQPVQVNRRDKKQLQELYTLCQRLSLMLGTFFVPTEVDSIRITPTCSRNQALSKAAIPFYFRAHKEANYWRKSPFQASVAVVTPLEYFHDDFDNLLLEGLIGLTKSTALNSLSELKQKQHLPIGIVALRISDNDHENEYPIPAQWKPGSIAEYNFKEFITEHSGLYHSSSIPKGGTLAVVFKAKPDETDGPVVATLMLPYVCCGQKRVIADPDPFVLKATGDQRQTDTGKAINITVLDNDQFDNESPIEVDFVYDLMATDDQKKTLTERQIDIDVLNNDLFDKHAPIEVDLLSDLDANDVNTKTTVKNTIDIDVLKNDNLSPGPVELDFDKDN